MRRPLAPWVAACIGAGAASAGAADLSVSGFGTLGYAISNRPFTYQRFIDNRGTFDRDSVAGVQLDARLNNEFGATLQLKAAPSTSSDSRYQASVAWAFLSYRPTNDWLIRAGKQRIPLYLNSENYDVGATYDWARLPTEMYSIAPSNDAVGLWVGKNWQVTGGELSLDGFWGQSKNDYRYWLRDDIPSLQTAGTMFSGLDFKNAVGLIASYKGEDRTFRIALIRARVYRRDGQPFPTTYPFVTLAPGIGYYQDNELLPGPGVPSSSSIVNTTVTVGADIGLPADFRVVGEFAYSSVPDSDLAPQGARGYASLLKRAGNWTPYITYAFMRSPARTRDLYTSVNGNTVPASVPGAAQLMAFGRAGADYISAFDQNSWSIGTSYSFSATSKLKAEFMRTHIDQVSILVDAPPGTTIHDQNINVFSLSYSVVF